MLAESAASAAKLYKEQEEKQKAQEQEGVSSKYFEIYSKLFQKKILPQFPSDTSNILRLNAISITFEMKVA